MRATIPVIFTALLLTGCATPQIDWAARVGHYTYDQAVMELGPPDKMAKLSDGSTVVEWLTQQGQVIVWPGPYYWSPGCYYRPAMPLYSQTYVPARFLRLGFDANGELKMWKEFAR